MHCKIPIVSWGLTTPIGENAPQTALMFRAGVNNFTESPFIDGFGEHITMSLVSTLPMSLVGPQRMVQLGMEALRQTLRSIPIGEKARVVLILALPERYSGDSPQGGLNQQGELLMQLVRDELPAPIRSSSIEAYPHGRGGGAFVIHRATELFQAKQADYVIVGGIDSYYEWGAIESLLKSDRLLTQDNLDGLMPGEGAAFLALAPPRIRESESAHPTIAYVGVGKEPQTVLSEERSSGRGFTEALKEVVTPLRNNRERTDYWITDLTSELYGVKEFQILIARFADVLGTKTLLSTPLREFGDMGAASLLVFCILAVESWYGGFAPDKTAICMGGSDSGARGVILLQGRTQWAS